MFHRRMLILASVFAVLFTALIGRLVHLQVVLVDHYRQETRNRIYRRVPVPPARGRIRDSTGKVLAEDRESFDLWLVPAVREGRGRRTRIRGTLGADLSPERLLSISLSSGAKRNVHHRLALRYLVERCELVAALTPLLQQENEPPAEARERIARTVLAAALRDDPVNEHDLTAPRPCFQGIPFASYVAIRQVSDNPHGPAIYDGIVTRIGYQRHYPAGSDMGHITGYVGQLNREDYRRLRGEWRRDGTYTEGTGKIHKNGRVFFKVESGSAEAHILALRKRTRGGKVIRIAGYLPNEMVGRGGLEQYYNQTLRGRHVLRLQRMERIGPDGPRRFVNIGREIEPQNGNDIRLTIDLGMQQKIREILRQELRNLSRDRRDVLDRLGLKSFEGVVVLMDPQNGAIKAMVSEPGYDPNTFREHYAAIRKDKRHPMLNKAIAGHYPPGSSIKPLIALAALHERKIAPETEFFCDGALRLGSHEYICMRRHRHGSITVTEALQKSCNVFFYQVGEACGSRLLYEWTSRLGLGHPTRIDLAGESGGHLPRKAYTGRRWSLGETYHYAIGQGAVDVTPLQIAVAYAAIANGGRIVRPHLRQDPKDPALNEPLKLFNIDPEALAAVRRGMWKVVNEYGGTAYGEERVHLPGCDVAGKTGSAQHTKGTHAWFACFAPVENPAVVCVVLVPYGNHGGATCGPIADKILHEFLEIPTEAGHG